MPLVLLVLFIGMPLLELYVIIQIGQEIGALPTIAILVADSIIGTLLLRSQGSAAWRRFNEATAAGRIPAREIADGALIIFGGALLLTPGFVTDIFGLILLIPPTRALVRRTVVGFFARRNVVGYVGYKAAPHAQRAWEQRRARRRAAGNGSNDDYVEGTATEYGDDEPPPQQPRLEP
jgi:UPF0716 protein FxsA